MQRNVNDEVGKERPKYQATLSYFKKAKSILSGRVTLLLHQMTDMVAQSSLNGGGFSKSFNYL